VRRHPRLETKREDLAEADRRSQPCHNLFMRTALRLGVVALATALVTASAAASGQAGVYGVIDRVVLEPASGEPDRIQVWGAFVLVEYMPSRGFTNYPYTQPARGYMYFKLPAAPDGIANARREWNDLKSVAGTKQAVAFAYWDRFVRTEKFLRVRSPGAPPDDPDVYYTEFGVVKLGVNAGQAALVEQLLKLAQR
jgi:hypothetical protein